MLRRRLQDDDLDDDALLKLRRQLSCYATALEMPRRPSPELPRHVDGMAVLVFDHAKFAVNARSKNCGLYGPVRWVELPRRTDLFDQFLTGVATALAATDHFASAADCGVCRLRFGLDKSVRRP